MSTTQQKLEWQKRYAREAARIQNQASAGPPQGAATVPGARPTGGPTSPLRRARAALERVVAAVPLGRTARWCALGCALALFLALLDTEDSRGMLALLISCSALAALWQLGKSILYKQVFSPRSWARWVSNAGDPEEFLARAAAMEAELDRFGVGGPLGQMCRLYLEESSVEATRLAAIWHQLQHQHERVKEMQRLRERMLQLIAECEQLATTQSATGQYGGHSWKVYPTWARRRPLEPRLLRKALAWGAVSAFAFASLVLAGGG